MRRFAARAAVAIVSCVVFVASLLLGVLLHLDLPASRRIAVEALDRVFGAAFAGTVRITRLERLTSRGLAGLDGFVADPEGIRVATVRGARVTFDGLGAMATALRGRTPPIAFDEVHVEEIYVALDGAPGQPLRIVRSFSPRRPGRGRGGHPMIELDRVRIDRARIGVAIPGVPAIDADVVDLAGSVTWDKAPPRFLVDGASIDVRGLGPGPFVGALDGRADFSGEAPRGSAAFAGRYGEVSATLQAVLGDGVLEASAEVPDAAPEALRVLLPRLPHLGAPVEAHATLRATIAEVALQGRATVGQSAMDVSATIQLPTLRSEGVLTVDQLDLADLDMGAPSTRLAAVAHVALASGLRGDPLAGTLAISARPGVVARTALPAFDAHASFTSHSVTGRAHVREPGLPTDLVFDVRAPGRITFSAEARLEGGNHPRGLPVRASGNGFARVEGNVDLPDRALAISGTAEVSALRVDRICATCRATDIAVRRGSVEAHLAGPFSDLATDVRLGAQGVEVGNLAFASVRADATGRHDAADVAFNIEGDTSPDLTGSFHVERADGAITITRAAVTAARSDVRVRACSPRIVIGRGAFDVDTLVIDGLGGPLTASVEKSAHGLTLNAHGRRIDAASIGVLLGRTGLTGTWTVDVALDADDAGGHGSLAASVVSPAVRARAVAELDGRRTTGHVEAVGLRAAKLAASLDGTLGPGSALGASAWTGLLGIVTATVHAEAIDVPVSARRWNWFAIDAGSVDVRARIERSTPDGWPDVEVTATGRGLTTSRGSLPRSIAKSPLASSLTTALNGADRTLSVAATVDDPAGRLLSITANATLPRTFTTLAALARETEGSANLTLPDRPVRAFGNLVPEVPPLAGDIALVAEIRGRIVDPHVGVTLRGMGLRATPNASAPPVDLELRATYADGKTSASLAASEAGRSVLQAELDAKADMATFPALGSWVATLRARASDAPLDLGGSVLGKRVRGRATGTLTVVDLGRLPRVDVALQGTKLQLGSLEIDRVNATGTIARRRGWGHVVVTDSNGRAEVSLAGGVDWTAGVHPRLDPHVPMEARVRARGFGAHIVGPVLEPVLLDFEGRLDGDLHVVSRGTDDVRATGHLVLHDGSFEIPLLGESFRAVTADLSMHPWGTLHLERVVANASGGNVRAAGVVVFKGFKPSSARAALVVDRSSPIRLAFQGAALGRVDGRLEANLSLTPDRHVLDAQISIPSLHVDLPPTAGHPLQSLDADEHIHVGMRTPDGFKPIPLGAPKRRNDQALRIRARVGVGRDVSVRRGTTLKATVTGSPLLDVTDRARLFGTLAITSGSLEVNGKPFAIESGVIDFSGRNPNDPLLAVTAAWDAPDGTRILANFSGPLTSGKLVLSSEPAHTQEEIVALILFGTPDTPFGARLAPETPGTAAAAGVAGSVVTAGLNRALSGITGIDITTRIDTSRFEGPRPALAVALSKSVSAQVAYNVGVPAPGENPDRTEVTIDWRIVRRFSIQATVGDEGSTSLDFVWRFRY